MTNDRFYSPTHRPKGTQQIKLPTLTFRVSVKPKLWCILTCLCDVSQLEDVSFPKQFRTLT